MAEARKESGSFSIARFLFMPQLNLSFQHFGFVLPVFIRTVAIMFEQAGLLPRNHPALSYGAPGVRKYGFFELMGESWRNLRMTNATPYQWGLYSAVVLMVGYVALSAVKVLFGLSGMFVGQASAQIFNHPNGATDIDSIPGSGSGGGMFNHDVPTSGAHADLGIMILDKILREGIVEKGGALQKSLGSLMQVYNTAVLVIAGVLLFWAVLSVVVDTAKTGQVGGGRHNMVWAPIRIVFALGLLIPLGSSGFSSGQFMVIKLAEWGSNLGTRGWSTYVENVVNHTDVIGQYEPNSMSPLVGQYVGLWLCTVTYNAYLVEAGVLNDEQRIKPYPQTGMFSSTNREWSFTNTTAKDLCGSIAYQYSGSGTDGSKTRQYLEWVTRAGGTLVGYGTGGLLGGGAGYLLADKLTNFKKDTQNAYAELFMGAGGNSPEASALAQSARKFACRFASPHFLLDGNKPDPLLEGGCPEVGSRDAYPDAQEMADMTKSAYDTMKTAYDAQIQSLRTYTPSEMIELTRTEGWAGMGRWYHIISSLNNTIGGAATSDISITSGAIPNDANSHLTEKLNEVRDRYMVWWQAVPSSSVIQEGGTRGLPWKAPAGKPETSFWPVIKSLLHGGKSPEGSGAANIKGSAFSATVSRLVLEESTKNGYFLFDMAAADSSKTYPLAQLAQAGQSIVAMGLGMIGAVAALQIVMGLLDASVVGINLGSVGVNAAMSVFSELVATIGTTLTLAGLLLMVYIPMIPLVRTVFSVLTWMTSVFEAVVMVPIAALAHITTEGEGFGSHARQAWILWLNVLLRPILTVVGYVAALLIFNTFVVYFHVVYARLTVANLEAAGVMGLFSIVSNTVIYVGIVYLAANSTFKLLDLMPNAMMKWIGGGQPDHSFDDHEATAGFISAGGQAAVGFGRSMGGVSSNMASAQERKRQFTAKDRENNAGVSGKDNKT